MEFRRCSTQKDYKKYSNFIKALYEGDSNYRDYVTPMLLGVLKGKGAFSQKSFIAPYLIYEEGLVGVVTFIIAREYHEVLQIAFLEYRDLGGKVAEAVLSFAQEIGREKEIYKISVGLNGHVNYSLGLSAEAHGTPSFGEVYTKPYYARDFSELVHRYPTQGEEKGILKGQEISLSSYEYPWREALFPADKRWIQKVQQQFQFRAMTAKSFKADMQMYTALNNACFGKHRFYFRTEPKECEELFQDLRFFMDQQSLIFVEYKGRAVGFLLWYPDWGELMKAGETVSWKTYIKRILYHKRIKTFKLIEWGVLPEFQGRGVPIALLYYCYMIVKEKGYKQCKTSWILDENNNSNGFAKKWAVKDHSYKAYQFERVKEERGESISKSPVMDTDCQIS